MNLTVMAEDREDLKIQIGETIRKARVWRKLTQSALADQVGVRAATISDIERGENMADMSTLWTIADKLEVTVDSLIGRQRAPWDDVPTQRFPASGDGKGPRLPEDLRELVIQIQGQALAAFEAANRAQATADEAVRRLDERGDKSA